jgi:hypothetical protein
MGELEKAVSKWLVRRLGLGSTCPSSVMRHRTQTPERDEIRPTRSKWKVITLTSAATSIAFVRFNQLTGWIINTLSRMKGILEGCTGRAPGKISGKNPAEASSFKWVSNRPVGRSHSTGRKHPARREAKPTRNYIMSSILLFPLSWRSRFFLSISIHTDCTVQLGVKAFPPFSCFRYCSAHTARTHHRFSPPRTAPLDDSSRY